MHGPGVVGGGEEVGLVVMLDAREKTDAEAVHVGDSHSHGLECEMETFIHLSLHLIVSRVLISDCTVCVFLLLIFSRMCFSLIG